MNTNENKIEIGKSTYEAPAVERMQVKSEGGFAASQPLTGNNQNNVTMDSWVKSTATSDVSTWNDQ